MFTASNEQQEKKSERSLLRSLRRYSSFFRCAYFTPFFQPRATEESEVFESSENCSNLRNLDNTDRVGRFFRNRSVLTLVFPPAFALYSISIAVSDVLRYTLLMQTVGVTSDQLSLVIGATDSVRAFLDLVIRLNGRWDAYKVRIVGTRSGATVAAMLYTVGIAVVTLGCALFGKKKAEEEDIKAGPSDINDGEIISYDCARFRFAIAFFTIGSFIMSKGISVLWNIWSQVIKYHARDALSRAENNATISIDFQGKMSQVQVVLRYISSWFAPMAASMLLTKCGPISSYYIAGTGFALLCLAIKCAVGLLNDSNIEKNDRHQEINEREGSMKNEQKVCSQVIGWSEMLPTWCSSYYLWNRADERTPLCPRNCRAGRFSKAFFHCGMFSCLTEAVRGGYTRIICLRAATSNLNHDQLAHILSTVGGVATFFFWLSDTADSNRRLAAFSSFLVLGIGHFGLGASSTMIGFYSSGVIFGLGEGMSSGLRSLIIQDYLSKDGPIGEITEDGVPGGMSVRRQVCNKMAIWADATLVLNGLAVGVLGHYLGMREASFFYGLLGVYAAYFSCRVMPNTKPGSLSEEPLLHKCCDGVLLLGK